MGLNPVDPQWLDRMYNNRQLVPEHAEFFQRWAKHSEAARHRRCTLDVSYGAGAGETLDIFPAERPNAPVLVFIHGGYWRSLDKSDHSFVAPAFVDAGYCVVVVNYALCPAVTVPHICLQMVKALTWVWQNIAVWGGDRDQLHVSGHSAGGHLVAMLMACQWSRVDADMPEQIIRSGMSISGLHEMESIRQVPFLKDALQLSPEDALRCSPAWMPAPQKGRCACVVGGLESSEFHRQNELLAARWGTDRVPLTAVMAGLHHFSIVDSYANPHSDLHGLALDFMDSR